MKELKILSPGKRLKEIRKILKLRQDEIAGDKFSKNYISMFENNKRAINAINATYLSNRINEYAGLKGYDINIDSSYLLKSDIDLAREKCEKWLEEVEFNLEITDYKYVKNLYRTIYLASKFELSNYRAEALYLKGVFSLHNERYQCAMSQLLGALVYYARENDLVYVSDIHEKIGIILYNKKELDQALVYFNLSYEIAINSDAPDKDKLEELKYYIALCYYEMKKYRIAEKMIGLTRNNSMKIFELTKKINKELAI
ncbi:MAG: transcriptional regulator [Tissierellales bacterium]